MMCNLLIICRSNLITRYKHVVKKQNFQFVWGGFRVYLVNSINMFITIRYKNSLIYFQPHDINLKPDDSGTICSAACFVRHVFQFTL